MVLLLSYFRPARVGTNVFLIAAASALCLAAPPVPGSTITIMSLRVLVQEFDLAPGYAYGAPQLLMICPYRSALPVVEECSDTHPL